MLIGVGTTPSGQSARRLILPGGGGSIPVNTQAPVITGGPYAGATYSCSTGMWDNTTGIVFAYQWKLDDVPVGTNSNSYSSYFTDETALLTCDVTPTNDIGTAAPSVSNIIALTDVYWGSVEFLAGLSGSNGATTALDESTRGRVINLNGASISNAQSKFDGSSLVLNGSTWLSLANDTELSWGGFKSFTVEGWGRPSVLNRHNTFASGRDSGGGEEGVVFVHNSNTLRSYAQGPANVVNPVGSTSVGIAWNHYALSRDFGTWRLHLNGNLQATESQSGNPSSGAAEFKFGRDAFDTSRGWIGNLQELRFTNGVSRYSSSFNLYTRRFSRG